MTRKFTRNASALRGIAPFIAVLTVMIALAALAQTRGAGQLFVKSHGAPMQGSAVPSNAGPLDSGTPLFLPAVEYYDSFFGFHTDSVAVGDLNGDGKPDLVVGSRSKGPTGLYGVANVLLGVGDGTFQEKGLYEAANAGVHANVALGDVNGDGKLDMLASGCAYKDCSTGVVTVRTGNGDGSFAGFSVFGTGGMNPSAPAVADFNGDGKLDLVVANCGSGCQTGTGTVGVLLGNGDATFQTAVTYGTGGIGAHQVIVADVNGDGKPDLIIPNTGQTSQNCPLGPGSVGVLLGKGDGTFQPAVAYGSGGDFAFSVAVADVNGDGHLDILVQNFYDSTSCTAGPLGVLLGKGDGTFQPVILGGLAYGQLALADVNGDGKLDIVAVGPAGDYAEVQLGNGDGTFQAPVFFYGTGGDGSGGMAVADVNGDGRPDLMVTNLCFNFNPNCTHGSVGVFLNDTGPHSPTTTSLVSNVNPAAVNQQVIYTATVKNQSGGPLTGTIAFKHGTATTTVKLVGGQAVYKVTYSGSGTHPITATYSGDADNATSTSATLIEYVGLVPTKTTLTTSGSPSFIGQPMTFTATVSWTYGTVPDGETVTFFNGTTAIGTGATAGGVAKFTTSSLTVGTHSIKATYPGDSEFKPSAGSVKQVVEKYPTTTTLTSSLNPSQFGQAVTFTAHVTGTGPAPTGNVKFLDGTTGIGLATLSGGVAKLTKSTLAVGTHPITAQYLGDASSAKSTSAVVNQAVQ
jgi:hypothetical protein